MVHTGFWPAPGPRPAAFLRARAGCFCGPHRLFPCLHRLLLYLHRLFLCSHRFFLYLHRLFLCSHRLFLYLHRLLLYLHRLLLYLDRLLLCSHRLLLYLHRLLLCSHRLLLYFHRLFLCPDEQDRLGGVIKRGTCSFRPMQRLGSLDFLPSVRRVRFIAAKRSVSRPPPGGPCQSSRCEPELRSLPLRECFATVLTWPS